MGKNLKGRELGKGISQRKDGRYQARYTNRFGKRKSIYSTNIKDLRKELERAKKEDSLGYSVAEEMTLNEWFDIWIRTFKKNCKGTTKRNYKDYYHSDLKKDLGDCRLNDLNIIAVQETFNKMPSDNARRQCKIILLSMMNYAIDAKLVTEHNISKIKTDFGEKKEKRVLTREETVAFLRAAENRWHYELFAFDLETGMRAGELFGLQWADIDLSRPCAHISHNLVHYHPYDGDEYIYEMHSPKTKAGIRTVPLTPRAVSLLKQQKQKLDKKKARGYQVAEGYEDFIFLSNRLKPLYTALTSIALKHITESVGIYGLTLHSLRHTFATRAIENGMNPKTLQKILGHARLSMTMDLYCHVSEDTLFKEMKKMEMEAQTERIGKNGVKLV